MPPQAQKKQLRALARLKAELEAREKEYLFRYEPDNSEGHDQAAFHSSLSRIRLLLGGTGSGKTICTMAEVAAAVTGQSDQLWWVGTPYKKPPLHCWVIKQSFPRNIHTDSILKKLLHGDEYQDPETGETIYHDPFIPKRFQAEYNKTDKVILLNNGSTIELKSAEQDVMEFASAGIDLLVVDEPISSEVFWESFLRMVRRKGSRMIFGMTPKGHASSFIQDLTEKADEFEEDVAFFYLDLRENKYADKKTVDFAIRNMPEEMFETVVMGKPAMLAGLVYGEWTKCGCWVDYFPIPEDWTRYAVHDPGMNNPAATIWIAANPKNNLYVYRTQYDKSKSADIFNLVKAMAETPDYKLVRKWIIDPFRARTRIPTIGDPQKTKNLRMLYKQAGAEYGIRFSMGPTQEDLAGISQRILATKLYIKRDNNFPNVYALKCPETEWLRYELTRYRWAVVNHRVDMNAPEKPHALHNHLMYGLETACALRLKYQPMPKNFQDMGMTLEKGRQEDIKRFETLGVFDTEMYQQ